ncbi:SPOR domain-containing protein [Parabacteroides bouchesdurhonensis]|uniref:HU domain-containing protein n=1 Tax=Parabacteroides bouchesdurhonensis TaxID=1936995 RepID=UPI000E521FB1|nr:SPOR domain-containing protein [Parabacteroides bouchesdurhonensis]RHJ91153.1 SPOR domain-containing protein [Bacteroides sp. AM07-16]
MLRIVTHIEHLLLVHDCVIVPKFGGFVLQSIPAKYQAEELLFYPSRKEIVFNTTLQHNDGLLTESYMQIYDVDYKKAFYMLEEDIAGLKETLQKHKNISLGNIGSFSIEDEGRIVFHPSDSTLFSAASFGLFSFCFPTLDSCMQEKELSVTKQKGTKDTLYIPVNRKLIRVVAASAAAIALFLLVSTPVKDVNQSAYRASFVPTEMVIHRTLEAPAPASTSIEVTSNLKKENDAGVPASTPSVTKEVKKQPALSVAPKPNKAAGTAIKSEESKKMYHIIIASFPSESQANEYIAGVRNECKGVNKILRDGKYRIYANKYDNRKQAESYMDNLRKNDKFKDAWLFISR